MTRGGEPANLSPIGFDLLLHLAGKNRLGDPADRRSTTFSRDSARIVLGGLDLVCSGGRS